MDFFVLPPKDCQYHPVCSPTNDVLVANEFLLPLLRLSTTLRISTVSPPCEQEAGVANSDLSSGLAVTICSGNLQWPMAISGKMTSEYQWKFQWPMVPKMSVQVPGIPIWHSPNRGPVVPFCWAIYGGVPKNIAVTPLYIAGWVPWGC